MPRLYDKTWRAQRRERVLAHPGYTPHRLINHARTALGAPNDNVLSEMLEYDHGQISRIRSRKEAVTPAFMVAVMDRPKWSIDYVRELAGLPADLEMRAPAAPERWEERPRPAA